MKPQIKALHSQALEAAGRFKRAEADLIDILQKADRTRLYLHLNRRSLFEYVVEDLGLSEGTTYNLITVSRKAREVPALQTAIRSGGLTVSKARKMAPVLTKANSQEWIQKAMTLSTRKLEAAVAEVMHPERDRPVGLHLSLPRQVYEKLKRAQELECQRQERSVSLEETLEAALGIYLEKQDPVQRAERILKKKTPGAVQARKPEPARAPFVTGLAKPKASAEPLVAGHAQSESSTHSLVTGLTQAIPAASRHQAHARDQGQCAYIDPSTAIRCEERKWVHLHHIRPRSQGGTHATENLTTLCSSHHRLVHHRLEGAAVESFSESVDRYRAVFGTRGDDHGHAPTWIFNGHAKKAAIERRE